MITRGVRSLVVALVCVAEVAGVAPAVGETNWRPKLRPAIRWSNDRTGSVSFAVKDTNGRIHMHRAATEVPMASTLKVMFMVAYFRQNSMRNRRLRDSDKALL